MQINNYLKFLKYLLLKNKLNKIIYLLVIYWAIIYFYPVALFGPGINIGRFVIYGAKDLSKTDLKLIFDKTENLLSKYPGKLPQSVSLVIPKSQFTYLLFNPVSLKAFGATNAGDNIWFRYVDAKNDVILTNSLNNNKRTFSGVLAHETMHVTLRKNFGFFTLLTVPEWIEEGICDFISQETSFPFDQGIKKILQNENDESNSYDYFLNYLAISELVYVEKKSVDEIIRMRNIYKKEDRINLAKKYAISIASRESY